MNGKEFFERYEAYCPKELAMDGDPVGLQIGTLDKDIKKVLVTLDLREQTVAEAIALGVDVILAKHPVIFRPMANLTDLDTQQKIVLDLARAGIAVYTSHTNIDIIDNGLNDWFCQALDITDTEVLSFTTPTQGIGRVGNIEPMTLADFAAKVKSTFFLDGLKVVSYDQSLSTTISRVAICGGSGGSYWKDAKAKGADVYITGDIYYHTAHDMLAAGLQGIDPGHHIEILFASKVAEILRSFAPEVEVFETQASTNPFISR
jgi:dinuclear metal center YbgI/SA1388 family protein